jgi:hypothetical protein
VTGANSERGGVAAGVDDDLEITVGLEDDEPLTCGFAS